MRVSVTHSFTQGFDLGFVGSEAVANSEVGTKYINNHLRLVIDFHANPLAFEGSRIVGFEVETASINHQVEGKWSETDLQSNTLTTCTGKDMAVDNKPQAVSWENLAEVAQADRDVIYTYDVVWQESDVQWASRWDLYLKMTDNEVHWFSIVNSFMIVLFLSGMVAIIMLRTLNLDFARYEELEQMGAEETGGDIDDSGWKLVHGEVFRPPTRGAMFATLIGTGVQTFVMSFITLVFALLGFLSPANRGALITTMLLLFAFTGSFSGYYSARIYKMFKLSAWKRNTFVTAFLLPSIVFSVFLFLNFLIKDEKSSGAVPFTTLVALMVLWLGIHVPLVYMGAYIGRSKPIIEPPVRINSIPRIEIPEAPFFMQPAVSILCAGALPFAAIFIELFFIMSSVWLHQFYYMFGFLFLAFLILMITCAEISIVIVYFQLCREDYHWWWRSFLAPASSGLYIFLYSSIYLHSELQIDKTVSIILYYSYMALVSSSVALVTGMVGFVASFFFVRKIYSVIKID